MKRDFFKTNYSYFFFILLFLVFACKNGESGDQQPTGTTPSPSTGTTQPGAALISGNLDTLVIDRKAFDSVNNGSQVVFSFVFEANDKLTLHGWILKGNKFDSLPNWKLKNGNAGPYQFKNGNYFGNVVLLPQDYNKIKNGLKPSHQSVIFAPFFRGENIAYKIFLSTVPAITEFVALTIDDIGAEANPSPPKNYN